MSRSLGIPVKLLHESSGHTVTVELKSGELYRGNLLECEDNWNCQLEDITYTAKISSRMVVKLSPLISLSSDPLEFTNGLLFVDPLEQDGKVSQLEHVFIRGSKVRFIVIPDMLKNAPMFNRVNAKIKGKSSIGVGRGRPAMRGRVRYWAWDRRKGRRTTSEEISSSAMRQFYSAAIFSFSFMHLMPELSTGVPIIIVLLPPRFLGVPVAFA
ncbi:hypothetical protein HID58_073376 [Brassica napus]|uniref:Small nuclear ribonucleoprotein Sm D3 n=1 Tax=Brassica napus TaxID=3708 RepID=A0ABQ7Z717_BRANA|nr:hypothetical protein HID58_073376 [Brassica napus]